MPDPAQTLRLLATLSLLIPLLAHSQTAPPLNDAERARRDAEKVLSFIKFQTVKPAKPPNEPADKPRRASTPSAPSAPATPTTAQAGTAAPAQATTVSTATTTTRPPEAGVALATAHTALATPAAPSFAPSLAPQPPAPATSYGASPAAASEAEQGADDSEAELQIQHFVSPVLPPSVQKTLGSGTRKVTVRFTVQPDGSVSQADAAADVPVRLVRPATEAILQWRFAPLAHARTVDVEIAFKRD